jgi:hypothetical protein
MTEIKELLDGIKLGQECLEKLNNTYKEEDATKEELFLYNYYCKKIKDQLPYNTYQDEAWRLKEHAPSLDYLYELSKGAYNSSRLEVFKLASETNNLEIAIKIGAWHKLLFSNTFKGFYHFFAIALANKHNLQHLLPKKYVFLESIMDYKLSRLVYYDT